MVVSRRSFLKCLPPAVLGAAAGLSFRQAASSGEPAHVRLLPSSPELENQCDWYFRFFKNPSRDFGRSEPKIRGMLEELVREIPNAVPPGIEVRVALPNQTRVYLLDDNNGLYMFSLTLPLPIRKEQQRPDRSQFALFLSESAPAILEKEPAICKSAVARELAKHILILNPELVNNPRFQPKSPEFNKELSGVPEEARERYTKDLAADKLRLWLVRDKDAANQCIERDLNSQTVKGDHIKTHPDVILKTSPDVHPSLIVRQAENEKTWEEIQQAKDSFAQDETPHQ